MTGGGPQTRSVKAGEHLQLLRSLAAELERAMQSISSNDLSGLEDSIASQQELSIRLGQLAKELATAPSADIISHPLPADMACAIRAASAELGRLNLRYSYLLKYSSRSVALMASLFNSFKGQLKEEPDCRSKMQTWSCQA